MGTSVRNTNVLLRGGQEVHCITTFCGKTFSCNNQNFILEIKSGTEDSNPS
jgi:hypothetical protein